MLDDALKRAGEAVEIEDALGEDIMLEAVKTLVGKTLKLSDTDRKAGSLPSQIKAAAKRHAIELPDGWKASAAIQLVSTWAEEKAVLPDAVLDAAAGVFNAIRERFEKQP